MSVGHYQEHISRVSNLAQHFIQEFLDQSIFGNHHFNAKCTGSSGTVTIIRWLFVDSKMERLKKKNK